MKRIFPFFVILRPNNAFIASITVLLGYWLSTSAFSFSKIILLFATAFAATGFGNVINDLKDIESDKISHPKRPLPKGEISIAEAKYYCLFLSAVALFCSFSISVIHGTATIIPLVLLTIYAQFLKGTPLAGNAVVAILVAYSILFGALDTPGLSRLLLPAAFAFLLNLSREIIKDIQDEAGDRAASVTTSAVLPKKILLSIVISCSVLYLSILFLPFFRNDFGKTYLFVCILLILPVHIYRLVLLISGKWQKHISQISAFYKIEMVLGLLAIAADKLI